MPAGNRPIIIAGGGIGGLAAAVAMGRAGLRCLVLEQAEVIGAIGYGLQLGPNVFWALERLGLVDAVLAKAHKPNAILALDARDGSEIIRIPTGAAFRARFTYPYVVIHRADLHDIFLEGCRQCPTVELRSGVTAEGILPSDDAVEVRTSAETLIGDAFIAADGINSRFRALVAPEGDCLQPTGFAAHRSLVPRSALPPHVFRNEVILWAGEGFHIVAYPLRDETLYNVVTVFQTDTFGERQDAENHRREVEARYRDAHPDMQVLLQQLNLERRWPISDRKPIRRWTAGRVALLGDAAHATLQSLAQGAGMSIEDGVCIAACLAADEPVPDALLRYQSLRRTRTARVQLESRSLWETYHCGGIAADVRRETFSGRTDHEYYDCLEWLYANPCRTMDVAPKIASTDHPTASNEFRLTA